MKRSASAAGLAEADEGVVHKAAKTVAAGDSDGAGGSSPPPSPMSADNVMSPATASENGLNVEKLSQDRPKSKSGKSNIGAAKKVVAPKVVVNSPVASTVNKVVAPRVIVNSPVASDDEGEGKGQGGTGDKGGEDDEEEEERLETMELGKYHTVDPDRMQQVLNRFTTEQMSRYECYRRSGFQRANMRRLLASVAGCPISIPMTIVMSGISKMFIGELVEIGRIVMTERNDVGPIRPSHIREALRRLKLEGKVPLRGRAPLFR